MGFRGIWFPLALGAGVAVAAEASVVRLVVADLPYADVWKSALQALADYPLQRAAEGLIVTARVERASRPGEGAFARIAERVTLRVEAFGERITRVTVEVAAEGWRDGVWVAIPDASVQARAIADRFRAAQG